MKKMLIVYYSWSNGNTKKIARELQKVTHADIESIDTEKPYTGTYDEIVAQGKREAESGFTPAIKPLKHSLSKYDVIAVGTPTWWYTMAPAILTFLKSNDFTGKTVIPFMTNAGWPGSVIEDMEAECKTKCTESMEIQFDSDGGDKLVTSNDEIESWMERINNYLRY